MKVDSGRMARAALIGLPAALAFVSLIDPRALALGVAAVCLALFSMVQALRNGGPATARGVVLLLTSIFAVTAWSEPRWCCDAIPYYIYLRSAAFDHDFDFLNDWAGFGVYTPVMTLAGRAINAHSIGPAILSAPFFLLAHLYVVTLNALGFTEYAPTGYSSPYLLSTAAGTGAAVTAGVVALWRTCAQRFSAGVATVAVVFGLLASTLPYYVFVVPSVAHGGVFAASALFLALWVKVEREASLRGWLGLAALLGVVSLFRWQAVVLGLMFVPLFIDAWRNRTGRWWWPLAAIGTSIVVFTPQMAAWWVLFGSPFAAPTHVHGMDWTSPHFVEVLFSADRGLFTWTPAMALGCLGFVLLTRRWPSFAWSAAGVFVATTWVNGGVAIWSGADAYGARRFDLLIPLWVVGLGALIQAVAGVLERRPLLAPAAALGFLVLWNLGLMRLHRNGVFTGTAPFEEVASRQAMAVRRISEDGLGRLWGPRGRNFAYTMFVGRYFYVNTGFDGLIDLTLPEVSYLSGAWSERMERDDFGAFRFAGLQGACVKVPFEEAFDLPVVVTARSMVEGQTIGLRANGGSVSKHPLPMDWTEIRFDVAAARLIPGENVLCLEFSGAARNGRAAAVRRFQLP
jgi:hypothetical protein